MGTVYMAEQTQPVRRMVALKVIKPGMDSRQVLARFGAERQALALMDYPNIAKVLDAGTTDTGRPYFVMELVKGIPITRFCDERRLTTRERLELAIPVCHAVQHAHQKGIIHRDLKPSNVLIALYDGKPVPKVIDFGVAKATGPRLTDQTLYTEFGAVVGTLEYMSPEQAELNQLDIDTRSDIYSLGALLYELLTGSTPLDRKRLKHGAILEMLRVIREEDSPRPSLRLATTEELPSIAACRSIEPRRLSGLMRGELDWIVMKALEKDRNRRYETANCLAADLRRYLDDEPVQACPPSVWYRFHKFARRNRRALATTTLLGVTLLAMVAAVAGSVGWAARDRAVREAKTAHQAQESLHAARTLIGESKFPLARQKLAEARGRIGNDRAPLRRLAEDVEALEAVLARVERFFVLIDQGHEAEISHDFELGLQAASSHGSKPAPRSQKKYNREPGKAVPIVLEALSLYGIMEHEDWTSTLVGGPLESDQVLRIRRTAYEELAWLADDVVRRQEDHRSGEKMASESAARQALVYLKKAEQAHRPTTSFYRIRSRCRKMLAEEEASRADGQLASLTPGTFALDHYLLGQEAYDAGNKSEAIKQFEAALRLEPTSYWSLMQLGWCLSYRQPPDYAEAARVYTGCIMKRPDYHLGYHHRGIAYANLRRYEDAVADYSKAIELAPTVARAWYNRGENHGSLGQWDKALADFNRAIQLDPEYAPAWSDRGKVHRELGQLDKALADCSRAIELDPKLAVAWIVRAYVEFGLGQVDKVLADSSKAIELDPKHAAAWNNRGVAYDELGRLDTAIAEFSKAIELDPEYAMAWKNRGYTYLRLGQLANSLADFTKAIELDPKLVGAWNNRGIVHQRLGQLDKALADCSKAIELDPKCAAAWSSRGRVYDELGQIDRAIAEYSKAIELDPKLAKAWTNRSNANRRLGQLANSLADSTKAIELDPKLAGAWLNRGATSIKQGQFDKALADYSRGLELAPTDAGANNDLAWLFATCPNSELRDPGRAVELAKKAVGLAPKEGSHWNTLGVAYYRAGDWKSAVDALTKSMELREGGDSNDWFFLAMAHWQLGDKSQARSWYGKAVPWMAKNQPKDEELIRFRAEAAALLEANDK
jgi:tetratricopeptide (TPR) repeat protein